VNLRATKVERFYRDECAPRGPQGSLARAHIGRQTITPVIAVFGLTRAVMDHWCKALLEFAERFIYVCALHVSGKLEK
jgi:hypothetical protein